MIVLVVALQSEANAVINALENKKDLTIINKPLYEGKLADKQVALAVSGIGKVNSAITTQAMINKYQPDLVINFGTAGGVDQTVVAKEYYQVKDCCQFDFDLRDLDGVPLGYIQDYARNFFPCRTVDNLLPIRNIGSADRFTESNIDNISVKELGCSLRDMEGAAIAHTCLANNVPLYMLKGITDVTGSNSTAEQFRENLKSVCSDFDKIISDLLAKL